MSDNNLSDVAAERAIISAICQYGKLAYIDCSDILSINSFVVHINQVLYNILVYVLSKEIDKKIDLPLLMSAAKEIGLHNEIDGEAKYIMTLFGFHVDISNVRGFAVKLRKLEETRGLLCKIDETAQVIRTITGNESLNEIISIAEKPIFDFTNKLIGSNQQVQQIGIGIDEYLDEIIKNPNGNLGIDIGCPIYQEAIGGLNMGVHVIGARKKVGKSFKALNASIYVAGKTKIPTLYLDTELQKENGQWIRMLSRISQIDQNVIKSGKFYKDSNLAEKIRKAASILKRIPLDYLNVSGSDFETIISIIRRWLIQKVGYNENGKLNNCLVIYDYLKITNPNDLREATEWQLLGYRMGGLHDLCVQYGIPILTFVQLNRENDIAASDRISWYCTSYSSLQIKSPEEIAEDGIINGSRKLLIQDVRFGEGLDNGDYINFGFRGSIATMKELDTRNRTYRNKDKEIIVEEKF